MSNTAVQTESATTPDRILGLGNAFWVSQMMSAAAHYKFFTLIAKGSRTAEAVANAARTDPRGTRMVLDGLAAVGVLEKKRDGYTLPADTDAFLVEGRPGDLTPMFDVHTKLVWTKWGELTEALENPEKVRQYVDLDEGQAFFPRLIRAILPLGLGPADALADHLGVGRSRKAVRVLDIGVGGGAWSMPFAQRDPQSTITGFDLPETLKESRKIIAEHGLASRYRFVEGNLLDADFGTDAYDFVVLGNMCHGLTPAQNRDLFARSHRALVAGGQLVIADMIPNDERSGPPFPVLFAVNMFVMGGEDVYTLPEYKTWLKETGYRDVRTFDTKRSHSPVIIAAK
jgi:2-polyprenyl-3-methyl-5-hydroxy-6-metoxy-1,4-benzoquinol methylase